MSIQPAIDYIDKDGFRANVGIVLTRGSGEVFLGGRVGGRGWQFPQGGVNRGERVEDALFRELKEEIGVSPGNTSATAASDRSSAGFCSSSSPTNRGYDSIPPPHPNSIAGAGPTIGRRCAKSSISSVGSMSGRFTISAN